jgi:hypothetical protein
MQKQITSTMVKGAIIGLIMILVSIAASFLDLQANGYFQWAVYGIFLIGVILSISQYGKQINYNSTFGNYFAHGFKISALVTLMMIIFLIVFMTIFPEFKQKAIDEVEKSMTEKKSTEEQMEQFKNLTNKFFMVFVVGGTLFSYLLFGAIASLIGAAVTKKDPHPLQDINQISE